MIVKLLKTEAELISISTRIVYDTLRSNTIVGMHKCTKTKVFNKTIEVDGVTHKVKHSLLNAFGITFILSGGSKISLSVDTIDFFLKRNKETILTIDTEYSEA